MPVDPTAEQIRALADWPAATPVVMLNLLKFAERVTERAGADGMPAPESYGRFGEQGSELLEAAGGRILWQGHGDSVVIGDDRDRWDVAVLVEYPSRQAFVDMVSSPEYREFSEARASALTDSRLIAMTQHYRSTDP